MLEKEYYTFEESLKIINQNKINMSLNDLYHHAKTGKIAIMLDIGSRPSIAMKHNNCTDDLIFIGCCTLQGTFEPLSADLHAIIANDYHCIQFISGVDLEKGLSTSNWSNHLPQDINKATPELKKIWQPSKIFNTSEKIDGFYLRPNYFLQLNGRCIPISALTDEQVKNVRNFQIGVICQNCENQVFSRENLIIAHRNLLDFIELVLSKASEKECSNPLKKTPETNETTTERDLRYKERGYELLRKYPFWNKSDAAKAILKEEKGSTRTNYPPKWETINKILRNPR